jgi:uncharacterized membrane protein HdeD (DUF308 family)
MTMRVPEGVSMVPHRPWPQVILGVLAIGIGIAAFAWPSATVHVVGVLFGLNLLITGSVRAVLLLFVPGYPVLHRVLGIVFGVFTAVVGLLCLRTITTSLVVLLTVVAIGWLLDGLVELSQAISARNQPGTSVRAATGMAMILGAFAILIWPKLGLGAFIAIGATVLVFVGIGQLISGLAGLRAGRDRRSPAGGTAPAPI